MSNIMKLYPYQSGANWVFDDKAAGLKAEPFVLGASEMITKLLEAKKMLQDGKLRGRVDAFELTFSATVFDGFDVRLRQISKYDGARRFNIRTNNLPRQGTWYDAIVPYEDKSGPLMTCWLCPALLCYFQFPPKELFVGAAKMPKGIDPIWRIQRGEAFKRFIDADVIAKDKPQ
jgi:hypothetical protein